MTRRELLKGIIATGVIALSPIKPALPAEAALPYVGRFQDLITRGRITVPIITSFAPKGVISPPLAVGPVNPRGPFGPYPTFRPMNETRITDIVGYSPKFGRFITRQEFESESVRLTPIPKP